MLGSPVIKVIALIIIMKSKQDLFTSESEGQAKFSGPQRSVRSTTKRSGKAAEAVAMLRGGGARGALGAHACAPALLLPQARTQRSHVLHSQTPAHLAGQGAGICHGANSFPVRENIFNLTTNPANSSWVSQVVFYRQLPVAGLLQHRYTIFLITSCRCLYLSNMLILTICPCLQ